MVKSLSRRGVATRRLRQPGEGCTNLMEAIWMLKCSEQKFKQAQDSLEL